MSLNPLPRAKLRRNVSEEQQPACSRRPSRVSRKRESGGSQRGARPTPTLAARDAAYAEQVRDTGRGHEVIAGDPGVQGDAGTSAVVTAP
jgi:hypothetical protein